MQAPGAGSRDSAESRPPTGAVELREDVPLKSGEGGGGTMGVCAGGPRSIIACFAALTAAVTLALLTQIHYGDFEVVPHGSVSSGAEACSRAGSDALKAGGGALDAAAAAALCLAVVAPHRTSLDASGSLLYWEYRQWRSQSAELVEWGAGGGGAGAAAGAGAGEGRAPRLLAALAALHAERGALPWPRVLQPAIDLARDGFLVSEGLAAALATATATATAPAPGSVMKALSIAEYLESLQRNTSAELSVAWSSGASLRRGAARVARAGAWRVAAGGAGASAATRALAAALGAARASPDLDLVQQRVISALQLEAASGAWPPLPSGAASGAASGTATGLAVIDTLDTYAALVTGLSTPFGSGRAEAGAGAEAAWGGAWRDEPSGPLDLAPAIMIDDHVCGTRYVIGAESSGALAQGGAALAASGAPAAVERPRVTVPLPAGARPSTAPAAPRAALNLVQQRGDALESHADSRGGGFSLRF